MAKKVDKVAQSSDDIEALEVSDTTEKKDRNPEYSKTSDEAIEKIIAGFAEISREVSERALEENNKPKFVMRSCTVPIKDALPELSYLQEQVLDTGYEVVVLNDIEYKNASTGGKYTVRISDVNGVYVNFDLLEYKNNIKEWEFDEVAYIAGLISKISGDTSKRAIDISRKIAEYLSVLIYYPECYVKTYSNIGWDIIDKQIVFKYDSIYSIVRWQSECVDSIRDSLIPESGGNETDRLTWLSCMRNTLNYSATDSLVLGAGISGIIRQLLPYTKETNININIVGERASGKSTIGHLVVSIFGDPAKLEGSFVDTTNKVDEIRAKRSVLPYVLDERMLRIEDTSEKARKRAIVMDIFREYEGKVKERSGKHYDNISGERTCGPIISSSVRSIMDEIYDYADLGQFRRFIELSIKPKDLFKDRDMANEVELIANSCYGYGIDMIISYMLEQFIYVEDEKDGGNVVVDGARFVAARFDEVKKSVDEVLDTYDVKGIESSDNRFALIIMSYQILRECLTECFREITEDDNEIDIDNWIPDKSEDILNLLIKNIVEKMERVNNSEKQKQRSLLVDYVSTYEDAFYTVNGKDVGWGEQDPKSSAYIGKIVKGQNSIKVITKWSYHLENILFRFDGTIPDPSKIKKYIELCETSGKAPDTSTLKNKLAGIDESELNEFLLLNPWITIDSMGDLNKRFATDKQERAFIFNIDLEMYREQEEPDGGEQKS